MSETEVIQGQWFELMGTLRDKFTAGNAMIPIENVNWMMLKNLLSVLMKKTLQVPITD